MGFESEQKGVERDFLKKKILCDFEDFHILSITLESVASTFGVEQGLEFIAALSDPFVTVKVAVASAPKRLIAEFTEQIYVHLLCRLLLIKNLLEEQKTFPSSLLLALR